MVNNISGRMSALIRDLVLESRRSGYQLADIRYESFEWNDERERTYATFIDKRNGHSIHVIDRGII